MNRHNAFCLRFFLQPKRLLPLAALLVAVAGCGPSTVGQACTSDANCDRGQICLTGLPGGFCTKTCASVGSAAECTGNSTCAQLPTAVVCSPTCTDASQCREGYDCTGTTGSTKVCKPRA